MTRQLPGKTLLLAVLCLLTMLILDVPTTFAASFERDDAAESSIIITKQTLGGADGEFTFSGDLIFAITTISGRGNYAYTALPPGSYLISESFDTDWDFISLACDDPTGGTRTTGPVATVDLTAGDVVNCVYVNEPDIAPSVAVELRNDADGDGSFSETEQAPAGGIAVSFDVTIANNGVEPATIDTIIDDTYLATVVAGTCDDLIGVTLPPADQQACRFEGRLANDDNIVKENTISVQVSDDDGDVVVATDATAVSLTDILPDITVRLDNDANGDGLFTDTERAGIGAIVPYQATITNHADESTTIQQMVDDVDDALFADGTCDELIGTPIAANTTVTCTYAGQIASSDMITATNRLTVEVSDDDGNTDVGDDTTTAYVPDISPDISVVKTSDADGDGHFHNAEMVSTGGVTVTYRVTVTNNVSEVLAIAGILDDTHEISTTNSTCIELIGSALPANGQIGCTFTGQILDDDNVLEISKTTVSVVDDDGGAAMGRDSSTVTVADIRPDITVVTANDANGDGLFGKNEMARSGGITVTYRVTITNNVTESIKITDIVDSHQNALHDSGTCDELIGMTLAANASAACLFEGRIAQLDNLLERNRVRVSVHDDDDNLEAESDLSIVTTPDVKPDIKVAKTNDANGDGIFNDSEVAPAPGVTVTYRVSVTNNVTESVVIIDIMDDFHDALGLDGACDELIGTTLAGHETLACLFSGRITDEDNQIESGWIAVVAADDDGNEEVEDDFTTVKTPDLIPAITVVQTSDAGGDGHFTNQEVASSPGITATFQVSITNDVTESLTITGIADSRYETMAADSTCEALIGAELAIGGQASCTYNGLISSQVGLTERNEVVVNVLDNDRNRNSGRHSTTVSTPDPRTAFLLMAENDANDDGIYGNDELAAVDGSAVLYRVTISNTTNITLGLVSIVDSRHDAVAPEGTCDDLLAAEVPVDSAIRCLYPGIIPLGESLVELNTVTVTMTSAVTSTVAVTNPVTSTIPDTTTNTVTNIVTATVTNPVTDTVGIELSLTDSSIVRTPDMPPYLGVNMVNDADLDGLFRDRELAAAGGISVTFKVSVTNLGLESVILTRIVDDRYDAMAVDGTCDDLIGTSLSPTQVVSCIFAGTISGGDDFSATNRVAVSGEESDGLSTTAGDTSTVSTTDEKPMIAVTKLSDGNDDGLYSTVEVVPLGRLTVSVRLTVTNQSAENVQIRTLSDDLLTMESGDCATLPGSVLPANGVAGCSYVGTLSADAELAQASVTTISVMDDDGNCVSSKDTSLLQMVDVEPLISVNIANDADGDGLFREEEEAAVDQSEVTFSVTITNHVTEPLTITVLVDSVHDLTGSACADLIGATVAASGAVTCTFTGSAPAIEATAETNFFSAAVQDDDGNGVSALDWSTVTSPSTSPAIELVSLVYGAHVASDIGPWLVTGETVAWTYVVSNTGDVILLNVTVLDEGVSAAPICVLATLDVGASTQCAADGTVMEGEYTAHSRVRAQSPFGDTVEDATTSGYVGYVPATVGDTLFEDVNSAGQNATDRRLGNGIQDDEETGIAGIMVQLLRAIDDSLVAETTSDEFGHYEFDNLLPDDYYLLFTNNVYNGEWTTPNAGSDPGADSDADPALLPTDSTNLARTPSFSLISGESNTELDAGLFSLTLGTSEIGDRVWLDKDQDGLQGPTEDGIGGIVIELFEQGGARVAEATTDALGAYRIADVPAGEYRLEVQLLPGYFVSAKDVGENNAVDNDADSGGRTSLFTLPAEIEDLTWDFGLYQAPTTTVDPPEPDVLERRAFLPVVHQ